MLRTSRLIAIASALSEVRMSSGSPLHSEVWPPLPLDEWKPTRIESVKSPEDGSDYAESRTLYIWIVGDNPAMP